MDTGNNRFSGNDRYSGLQGPERFFRYIRRLLYLEKKGWHHLGFQVSLLKLLPELTILNRMLSEAGGVENFGLP